MTGRGGKLGIAVASLLTAASLSACSAGLDSLPLPAPSVGAGSYTLTAVFSNALNLPTEAKVRVNGADVGLVESMSARDYSAVVTMRIRAGVILPVGTTAELRSATPMGDVFVALVPPISGAAAQLHSGDTIPEQSTSAAATVEDVLTRVALLVNGGVVRDVAKVVNGLGTDLGGRGTRLASLIDDATRLVRTLSARSNQIQTVVRAAGSLTATVAAQQSTLNDAVAAAGPALDVLGSNTDNIVQLAVRLDEISGELERFPSINGTGNRSLVADIDNLAAGLATAANEPGVNLDNLNRTIAIVGGKVGNGGAASADVDVAQLAFGALPDPNFPGDPKAKLPAATDWTNFVGSLAYTLNRLHDRVTGHAR